MERQVASYQRLREGKVGGRQHVWLSDLPDTADLQDLLDGDACIWGYTLREWNEFAQWQKFDERGSPTVDVDKVRWHQFVTVLRDGEPPDGQPIFPFSNEAKDWADDNYSPHLLARVVQISDELSGWKMDWDPFGRRNSGS